MDGAMQQAPHPGRHSIRVIRVVIQAGAAFYPANAASRLTLQRPALILLTRQ